MSGSGGQHWFDRLAVRTTRRGALKVAALAGAGLALPLSRAETAKAADPHACQQGCNWAAHQRYSSNTNRCDVATGLTSGGASGLFGFTPGLSFLIIPAAIRAALAAGDRCYDTALVSEKAAMFDCLQPNCPGFDPKAAGGPCETCTSDVGSCCPDPLVVQGYSCCTLGCACNGDDVGACHGSTTPC
jgi:hypothetical protein